MTLAEILQEVHAERTRQIAKWGDGQSLTPLEYCAILGEEFGEVCRAVHDAHFAAQYPDQIGAMPGDYSQYRKELIQVAAVCVAAIQNLPNQQV
jgi:NTP pyrophosphatase (non-canonical NTP hydrolase)